jgi:predicted DNA-binding transcriptional regulator AlpA
MRPAAAALPLSIEPYALDVAEVCRLLSIGRSTLFQIRASPDAGFPLPINLGGPRWLRDELEQWAKAQPRTAYSTRGGARHRKDIA